MNQVPETSDVPERTLLPPRIIDLVESAACAAQTPGAFLALLSADGLTIVCRHGEPIASAGLQSGVFHFIPRSLVYVHTVGVDSEWPELQFMASVAIEHAADTIGFLSIISPTPHRLSGAQEYLLRTIAADIGDQFELEVLRRTTIEASRVRNATEERLRLLESVVVNANDAVLITEAEPIDVPGPRIVYANAAFTRTTGYTLEEVFGKTPRILQGSQTDDKARSRLREALKQWQSIEVELLNYRKDGTAFWVELSIVPVADETGWFTHWVSVQRDVSERKAHEENAIRIRLAEAQNEALALEVQERRRIEKELAFTAFHDQVTGLRNRAYFIDKLNATVQQSLKRPGSSTGLIFLDVDNFKEVNDSRGHSVGDLLLMQIANRLKASSRPQDTISRIGGDEFTILCEGLSTPTDIIHVAERSLEALRLPFKLMNVEVTATVSMGISLGNYEDAEHILRDADIAMYRAKKEGGGRYALFDEEMHESAKVAMQTRLELRSAIENKQMEVFYQPIVDALSYKIHAVEALVRWRHPIRGLVPPLEFIGIAEETGLIVELGSWVLHEVCQHFQRWAAATTPNSSFCVNVNVSSRQLEDAGFLDDLQGILTKSGIDPSHLELEITESVFLRNADRVGELFNRIRSLGVRIAFDDFGTGYSSLSYLERYPIDTIKIDQVFVQRLVTGQANADIVRMIVGLANALGVSVSAEGIEDTRQRDALLQYGCILLQGYLYSRPIPFEEISALLMANHVQYPWHTQFSADRERVDDVRSLPTR